MYIYIHINKCVHICIYIYTYIQILHIYIYIHIIVANYSDLKSVFWKSPKYTMDDLESPTFTRISTHQALQPPLWCSRHPGRSPPAMCTSCSGRGCRCGTETSMNKNDQSILIILVSTMFLLSIFSYSTLVSPPNIYKSYIYIVNRIYTIDKDPS